MAKSIKVDKERLKALAFGASLTLQTRATIVSGTLGQPEIERNPKEDKRLYASIGNAVNDGGLKKAVIESQQRRNSNITWQDVPADPMQSGLIDPEMVLDESQEAALRVLSKSKYSCLIGAAGTGKTSLVKRVLAQLVYGLNGTESVGLQMLDGAQGPSIAVVAFTGKATSVLKENLPAWMHPCVKTIHSLLEFKPSLQPGAMFYPSRDRTNPLAHRVIVVDEASMLGLNLWHDLIDACTEETIIILMGDLNQLVPVADAPFFAHVLSAGLDPREEWQIAELTTVHRQKGIGGQRVLDTAYAILNGKTPEFDPVTSNSAWRVAGILLPPDSEAAHKKIAETLYGLQRIKPLLEDGAKDERNIYEPYRDLVLTAGNGDDENSKGAAVQQGPLNETLSRLLLPDTPDNPVFVIDAGRVQRQFSVGNRVMARRNETPDTKDRVTNGMTGIVTKIEWNSNWHGDRNRFGTHTEVMAYQYGKLAELRGESNQDQTERMQDLMVSLNDLAIMDMTGMATNADVDRSPPSSHNVTVKYETGAVRTYTTAIEVENVQLAYAMTTHKAQGSQAETVFIVVHSAVKHQLSVEWLYTAVTRAKQRLVIFYNDLGLRSACARRQIHGRTLQEKVERYRKMYERGDKLVRFYP